MVDLLLRGDGAGDAATPGDMHADAWLNEPRVAGEDGGAVDRARQIDPTHHELSKERIARAGPAARVLIRRNLAA